MRTSGAPPIAAIALAAWLGATAAQAADPPQPDQSAAEINEAGEQGNAPDEQGILSAPPFPELPITEALRIQIPTFAAPNASMRSGEVSVARPEIGARGTWFANDRILSRATIQFAETAYDFRGDAWQSRVQLPAGGSTDADSLIDDLELHATRFTLDGAYLLTDRAHWFASAERWSALGSLYIGSRWEDGEFRDGLYSGGAIGFGYEASRELRLALGVSLRSPLDKGHLNVDPLVALRWRPYERVTVRTRELGLQVELTLTPALEVHLTGFRSTDGYRLNDRPPFKELFFRDRYLRFGGGFEWTLANWLRVRLETGALAERHLRLRDEDLGTLVSRRVDPSAYWELRFELRL